MSLSQQEISSKGNSLIKHAASDDAPNVLLTLLDELRKGVVANEQVLRDTGIGIKVNKLKHYKDKEVARKAQELVTKWRNDVRRNGEKAKGSPAPAAGKAANGTASPAPAQKPKAKLSVAPERRNSQADEVDINVTGDKVRNQCFKLMYDGLAFMSEEAPDDVINVARSVELAAYNAFQPPAGTAYKDKIRSLYQNLKNKNNMHLRKGVLSGSISAERFVKMSHDELKSAERRKEDEALQKENMNKAMVAQEEKSISASLTCGKCGQKKVSYSQAQTRSADEPMTTFCECTNCGNRWKFS